MKWVKLTGREWLNMDQVFSIRIVEEISGSYHLLFQGADDKRLARAYFHTHEEAEIRLREIMAEVQS